MENKYFKIDTGRYEYQDGTTNDTPIIVEGRWGESTEKYEDVNIYTLDGKWIGNGCGEEIFDTSEEYVLISGRFQQERYKKIGFYNGEIYIDNITGLKFGWENEKFWSETDQEMLGFGDNCYQNKYLGNEKIKNQHRSAAYRFLKK